MRKPLVSLALPALFLGVAGALVPIPRAVAEVHPASAREYDVTWQERTVLPDLGAAWQAPNPAQELRAYFTPSGLRIVPGTEDTPSWQLGLSWIGYGRGSASWEIAGPTLSATRSRVDYRRGELAEWYENSPKGIDQGFTLSAPPEQVAKRTRAARHPAWSGKLGRAGVGDAERLIHVDLALTGDLSPVISADGRSIDFVTSGGSRAARYADLRATDARGSDVPAWMEGFSGAGLRGIRLVLDARDAAYPIAIDPLTTSPVWTVESNQADAHLGKSVATAGDVNGDGYSDVLVGTPDFDNGLTDRGRVDLYLGSPSGLSTTPAWTIEGNAAFRHFGTAVATAGDVNGDGYSDVLIAGSGVGYVYMGSPSGLAATPAWTGPGGEGGIGGTYPAVAAAGDVNGDGYADIIVSQITDYALLFLGSASGLSSTPAWTGGPWTSADLPSVGPAGDVNGDGYADVLVGLPYDPSAYGTAFLFLGSASGLGATPAWTGTGTVAGGRYGLSVSTAGDVDGDGYADVLIGEPTTTGNALINHLYYGSATGLSGGTTLHNTGGDSVATAGDVNGDGYADVILGLATWRQGPLVDVGKVFVLWGMRDRSLYDAGAINQSFLGVQVGEKLGYSVSSAGDVNGDGYSDIIVGAPYYDNGETDEGRAFVYYGSSSLPAAPFLPREGNQDGVRFGDSLSAAGDVNGDGYADVIVAAPYYENGQAFEGRVFGYLGSPSGLATTPAWTAESDVAFSFFGSSIATAGDVNGDGYSDVIVGAPNLSNGQVLEGKAFVYDGSPSGLASIPSWTIEGNAEGNVQLGRSVSTAGDVNGDGYDDVIVGAPFWSNGQSSEGRAYVYFGSAPGLSALPAWTGESDQDVAYYGWSVSSAGDVNGDGYSDVIVGAPDFSNGEVSEGRVFVYLGSATGLGLTPAWTAESNQAYADLGYAVASAGDVNGDGYADVIVGAPYYSNGQSREGRAFAYLGSPSGLSLTPAWIAESDQADASFGYSVAPAGDVNGDGYADVIVGAPYYDSYATDDGKVFIYYGSASGLAPSPASAGTGGYPPFQSANWGASVSTAGDINGDGYADVLLGAPFYENGQTSEGGMWDVYGNAMDGIGLGLASRPEQRRADGSAPIARIGLAQVPDDGLTIRALGRSPFGRGKARLQVELEPFGTPFNGTPTHSLASWTDTGVGGTPLDLLIGGLHDSTLYHWRARVAYNPATTPFQQYSRWFTIPWGSQAEAMLRTPPLPAGSTPGAGGGAMMAGRSGGLRAPASITLSWGASCTSTDSDFEVYQGTLGKFTSHVPITCSTGGETKWTFAVPEENSYFLVVPSNASREGSYGVRSSGAEIPPSASACLPQEIASCP